MTAGLFGTDGIRAKAGVYPLDDSGLANIGKAIGYYFSSRQKPIIIGWDPRESSESIRDALSNAIISTGVDVEHIGVITTPGLAYLTNFGDVAAGVMITASHNPYQDNGIKIFLPNGNKLSDNDQKEINQLIDTPLQRGEKTAKIIKSDDQVDLYIDYLVEQAQLDKKLKVAFDCANGAASAIIKHLVNRINIEAVVINDQPNGTNINHKCGATDTSLLQKTVIEHSCDIGLAFDGDADRLIAVDASGKTVNGDVILYVLAVTGRHRKIAATTMSNLGLEHALARHNIALVRTQVGDRYVLEAMHEHGIILGGEQSGHIILGRLSTTGDGILAGIVLLTEIIASNRSIAEWSSELQQVPQTIINLSVEDTSFINDKDAKIMIKSVADKLGDKGRVIVRASGTEPLVRIMVESGDAKDIANQLHAKLLDYYNSRKAKEYNFVAEGETPAKLITLDADQTLIEQLIKKSKQPNIKKFTPKDAVERFASVAHYGKWLKKGRIVHWLLGPNRDLAGIIWYGLADFPSEINVSKKPKYTFAIRLYDGYQGHGLAKPFMRQSLSILLSTRSPAEGNIDAIWLQTDLDNKAAIHVYEQVGYREVGRDDKRVTMIIDSDNLKQIQNAF